MLTERNEALRPELHALRDETARLFAEATELKHRWALLDQAQQEAVKVSSQFRSLWLLGVTYPDPLLT